MTDLVEKVAALLYGGHTQDHSWDQTVRAAINVVLEEAAKVADEAEKRDHQAAKEPCNAEELAAFQRGAFKARNIAAAIRAMKEEA